MQRAFVLLNYDLGYASTLAADMEGIPGVKEAYIVYGVYDLMIKVEADSMDKLKEFISRKIRRVKGVKSTLTMLIMDN